MCKTMNKSEKFDILGVEFEWKLTAAETDHHYCVLEATVPPGVVVPPHRHPDQEAFFVLEGAPEFASETETGLEWCFATPGEMINVTPMSLHGFRNPTDSDVKVLITCAATLGNFFVEAGLPIYLESPYRSSVPSRGQIARVLEIGERHGHIYPKGDPGRPGKCGSGPRQHTLARLITHPALPNFNRAYMF
jgi:quercetin dioxygenase-like cupin family protein